MGGVRGKLVTAIGLVAAMTVVAGVVSWFFYSRIEHLLISVIHEQTPTITNSLKLAEASSRFAAASLAYNAARNHLQRQSVAVALNQQAHQLEEILGALRATPIDHGRLDLIQSLVATLEKNLEQQNRLVEEQLNLQSRVRRGHGDLDGAYDALLAALERAGARAGADGVAMRRLWRMESAATGMVRAYHEAQWRERVESLRSERDAFQANRARLSELAAGVSEAIDPAGALRAAATPLIERERGDHTDFEALDALLQTRGRLLALSNDSGNIASRLSNAVVRLVDEVEAAAAETGRRAGEQIGAGRQSMLIIAVATFLGPLLFVWLLVGRTVVVPLTALANATRRIARGDLAAPIPTVGGHDEIADLAAALVVFRDTTGALRASETRLRSILEAAVYPILITRLEDGAVLFANDQAAALFGAADGPALVGRMAGGFFEAPNRLLELEDHIRRDGRVQNVEELLQTLDGAPFWTLLSAVAMTYQDEPALLASVNDISERKAIEEAQRHAKEEAERALQDLKRAQQQLVQSEKLAALGGLVAGVAHEINTPIGIVLTSSSLLAEETETIRARAAAGALRRSDFHNYLEMVTESAAITLTNIRRAADLVQSFKNVAADQVSDAPRRYNLKDYVTEVMTSLSPSWRKAGHRIHIDCADDIEIDGSPGVLSHILTNFVTNSVIHGFDQGQHGVLSISASRPVPDMVELVYTDSGRGVPVQNRDKVFEPFFTTRRGTGSTGLGLHIVYNLVTARLGGHIDLDSRDGGGVRFTLRFPLG